MTKSIHTPEMQALTRWLREMRESLGLSMREMGARLGTPHSFVQKVESGERRLDVVEYVWYCRALEALPQRGLEIVMDISGKQAEMGRNTLGDSCPIVTP